MRRQGQAHQAVFDGINRRAAGSFVSRHPRRENSTRFSLAQHDQPAGARPHRHLNRSYYERALVVRVHPEILAKQKSARAGEKDRSGANVLRNIGRVSKISYAHGTWS